MTRKIKQADIAKHTNGRKFIILSEKGVTRIQLSSRRKDGSDFETLTVETIEIESAVI